MTDNTVWVVFFSIRTAVFDVTIHNELYNEATKVCIMQVKQEIIQIH